MGGGGRWGFGLPGNPDHRGEVPWRRERKQKSPIRAEVEVLQAEMLYLTVQQMCVPQIGPN
jgi:hypothetical protein